jgi:hypothetical protein
MKSLHFCNSQEELTIAEEKMMNQQNPWTDSGVTALPSHKDSSPARNLLQGSE